ncbi:MAG: DNA adenine methylase [Bacteroidales bacterium]|jgi:DNA adenine methylase
MKTPITYWGGKQLMTDIILPLIPPHRAYNEPFFGGGAVFFAKRPSEVEFINDINGEMVNFYRTLKLKFDELKTEVDCTLHSEYQHRLARGIYDEPLKHSDVLRAWAVWMLSKQSIYAILTNGWSVSIDKNKARQIQWSKQTFTNMYARRLERTSIFCRDALSVIESTDRPTTFHYLDPPYYQADMGHYGGYTLEDFTNLLNTIEKIQGKFLLSTYPSNVSSEYVERNGWNMIEIKMHKNAGGGEKTEVLTYNYESQFSKQLELF